MIRKSIHKPNHPIATKNGNIKLARFILWGKFLGKKIFCNWCNAELFWMNTEKQRGMENAVCADHLDRNQLNDTEDNIVPSCRECNANRHKNGRRKERSCLWCKINFLPDRPEAIFCSNKCCAASRTGIKKGTKTKHGTISRYTYGCRCHKCRGAKTETWKSWYMKNKKHRDEYDRMRN